ncbi:hypothetical protein LTR92_011769, partial [Exophiala xenobiotica]
MAAAFVTEIQGCQKKARETGKAFRLFWPMIVLRCRYWRSHQLLLPDVASSPEHLKLREDWMKSYRPENCFTEDGKLIPELRKLAPEGDTRMSANPVSNGGLIKKPSKLPDFRDSRIELPHRGTTDAPSISNMAVFLRDIVQRNLTNFRLLGPDKTKSNKPGGVYK